MIKIPEAAPCHCPTHNPECARAGQPMTMKLWEYCSGNCGTCKPTTSNGLRYEWDRRAAMNQGLTTIKRFRDPWQSIPWWAWGDWVARGLMTLRIRKKKGCGCTKRQHLLNAVGYWFKRVLAWKSITG